MSKIKSKFLVPTILSLVAVPSIALCGYAFSQLIIEKVTTYQTDNKIVGWTREDEAANQNRYIQDALEKDAHEKAKTNSVLFYKITNIGVIIRFSFVAHMMKILELNPNKIIRVVSIDKLDLDYDYFKQYPNVEFEIISETDLEATATYAFNLDYLQLIYDEYGTDKKVDAYFDDTTYMHKIELYLRGFNSPLDKSIIYNEFILLGKLESINFFADGTKSVEYFTQFFKHAFLLSNNLYNSTDKNYTNAKLIREDVKADKMSQSEFIKNNNALLFLTSFLTIDFTQPNKNKYFLPTTDFIPEINRLEDNDNYKDGENDFFSPYNSQNLNIISFIKNLDQLAVRKILKIDKSFDPEYYIKQMNNNKNYIYSGGPMSTQDRIDSNIRVLVSIKNYANKHHPTESDKIIVWFKGHPRDNDILEKLTSRLQVLYPGDDGSWIRILDNKVPFEFYSVYNVFDSDPINNKEVFLFSTYSTLVMMMYANGQESDISKIIIYPTPVYSIEKIRALYGYDSKIFSKNKMITLEDFEKENSQ